MFEEIELSEEQIDELFNKLGYAQLEQLISIMKFNEEKYNNYISKAYVLSSTKVIKKDKKKANVDSLTKEELIFIYSIVDDVYFMLESARYMVDYEVELAVLGSMENKLINIIESRKVKVK